MEDDDLRLVLEYLAMEKPARKGSQRAARRNVSLNKEMKGLVQDRRLPQLKPPRPQAPYGRTGSTDWQTLLTHIKRVFRKHKEACAVLAAAPPDARAKELRQTESFCQKNAYLRALGVRPTRLRR